MGSGRRSSAKAWSWCVPLFRFGLFADAHDGVAQIFVSRHDEIERRRNALVDAAGEIEFRLVARAKKAAEPVGTEIGRRDLRAKRRRAAEMRADADGDPQLGLDRAIFIFAVLRLLRRFRFGIENARIEFG